ncbi:hypothetical protein Celaphus_00001777 [Cervus elaphus hippelaphus]|uniref:Uncharacterized protein n=1 Tax=Cervus elaphus hippelaphus TaxID=46360 RepID=A0A212CF68_CEREH|nr:hypothetical protein Celaphus_00001777 [Cervus elaphus hippelaphus]
MAEARSIFIRILTSAFQKQNLNTVVPTSAGGLSGQKTSLRSLCRSLLFKASPEAAGKLHFRL